MYISVYLYCLSTDNTAVMNIVARVRPQLMCSKDLTVLSLALLLMPSPFCSKDSPVDPDHWVLSVFRDGTSQSVEGVLHIPQPFSSEEEGDSNVIASPPEC